MSTHHGILLHVVFSTKFRFKCISENWSDELYGYIGGTIKEHSANLLAAGGIEDHVHLLMKISPKFAISTTIQLLKANSSRWINERRLVNAKFSWQRGYSAFSVSESKAATVFYALGGALLSENVRNFRNRRQKWGTLRIPSGKDLFENNWTG